MKVQIILTASLIALASLSFSQIYKTEGVKEKGIVYLEETEISGVVEPEKNVPFNAVQTVTINQPEPRRSNDILKSVAGKEVLFPGEFSYIEINTADQTFKFNKPDYTLDPACATAINRAPDWLAMDLHRQFRKMRKYYLEDDYALIINNAPEKLVDEVAFTVANMSLESLRDTRFRSTMNLLVENADYIYRIADSLKYVRLVEHGTFASGDYYTTAEYRIKSGSDTIWSEIPKEIYYWYLVHPKIDREGVYKQDNSSSTQFRTYGYFWREYLWNNPSSAFDYRQVNRSNSRGSVDTIQRFGALMKQPTVLWNRVQTYLPFNRTFDSTDNALDILGNWASRSIPVIAAGNRPFEPNQCIFEHDGNCHEDAILVAAAARTALIPIIHLNTSGEDHAFGAINDGSNWYHYEFFRGGLDLTIDKNFAGITNMMWGGSYGWTTSIVQGARPDGYRIPFSDYYTTKLCNLEFKVSDKNGVPVDGAKIIVWCSPGPYSSGWVNNIGYAWTDHTGTVKMTVGAGKKYAFQVYHPKFNKYLPSQTTATVINTVNSVAGQTYQAMASFDADSMPDLKISKSHPMPQTGNFGVHLNFTSKDIVAGILDDDVQKSQFALRNDTFGSLTFFLCDEANFNNFKNNQPFEVYMEIPYFYSGNMYLPLPSEGKWYVVLSNQQATTNYQELTLNADLLSNAVYQSVEIPETQNESLVTYPNPFSKTCYISKADKNSIVEVYSLLGNLVEVLDKNAVSWSPSLDILPGVYLIRECGEKGVSQSRVIYLK